MALGNNILDFEEMEDSQVEAQLENIDEEQVVKLISFSSAMEAALFQKLLRQNNIVSFISNESHPIVGSKNIGLHVLGRFAIQAWEFVKEYNRYNRDTPLEYQIDEAGQNMVTSQNAKNSRKGIIMLAILVAALLLTYQLFKMGML